MYLQRIPIPHLWTENTLQWSHLITHYLASNTHLICLFGESLQNVRLPGVVAIGVLQTLQNPLPQNQHRDSELVPEELHGVDVHNHVDRVGQQLQGKLCFQECMDLLHVIWNIFTNVLQERNAESVKTVQPYSRNGVRRWGVTPSPDTS